MKLLLKPSKRRAVSPVIATLLLIAIAVAAAIIVYAFVTGLIGGLTSSGASLVVVSGSLTVPSGSGAGSLVVTINNKASNAINAITIASTTSDPVGMTVSFAAQNQGAAGGTQDGVGTVLILCGPTTAAGCAAADTDGVAIGSSASAVGAVQATSGGATAGTTYTFVISAYIGSSTTPNVQTFSVTEPSSSTRS